MICPKCNAELVLTERDAIEVDYCPRCRGVWLDRGELEKLIAAATARSGPGASRYLAVDERDARRLDTDDYRDGRGRRDDHDDDDEGYRGGYDGQAQPRRRRSFLENIFDLD
jgi:uncharacterized protein